MRNNKKPKNQIKTPSPNKKIILIVVLIAALPYVIASGVRLKSEITTNYSIAKMLPVNNETKNRAFWFTVGRDKDKLERLKQEKKIVYYYISSNKINVAVEDDKYLYSFSYLRNSLDLPHVSVASFDDASSGNKVKIGFNTDGTIIKNLFNWATFNKDEISTSYREISDEEINQLTKKGLEFYNQFIDDYEKV